MPTEVRLSEAHNAGYEPGRPFLVRALWQLVEAALLLNPAVTSYRLKRGVLRAFGARIGQRVIIKPNVHIKYPWRLTTGDDVWLGERAWLDNRADVVIENDVCISQGAYICTGNHDWADGRMPLRVAPVTIKCGSWLGAFSRIAPGVTIAQESIVTLGAVVFEDTEVRGVYRGNPATHVGVRRFAGRP